MNRNESIYIFSSFPFQRRKEDRENRYGNVIRSLVWRYISSMHRRFEQSTVTEDDINEVKSDISAMRYEMLEVFEKNGMDISSADKKEKAHLAKRIKVWERRLMKDFHVAPMPSEEEEPSTEKGIARFRRVARQVVHQTTSHKWGVAVRGITDTQIGRCRNRESFRNQQNLQRAMEEAKRLVLRSPVASRPCTPVEIYDPNKNTLLELLKNITEEIGETTPQSGIRTTESNDSPIQLTQQLNEFFVNKSPSPLPPNVLQKFEAATAMQVKGLDRKQPQSISSILSQQFNEEADKKARSPSLSIASTHSSKSQEPTHQKSITSIRSQSASGEDLSSRMQSPPPLIQITRTESCKLTDIQKLTKSQENLNEIPKTNASPPINTRPITPTSIGSTKVMKRKAPAPIKSTDQAADIAISRPVPSKIDGKKGMIPPPPNNEKKDTTSSNSAETSFSTHPVRASLTPRSASPVLPSPVHSKKQTSPPIPAQQINFALPVLNVTMAASLESVTSDSSENLIPMKESKDKSKAVGSPTPALRPPIKVAEVTTIKRQPKTGWL